MARNDEKIIHDALLRFRNLCDEKQVPQLNKKKLISERTDILQGIEKCLVYLKGKKYSITEKRVFCDKGKKYYQKYCCYLKHHPDLDCTRLSQKMDELLLRIAIFETGCLERMREQEMAGEKIDLEQLLAEDKSVCIFIRTPIDVLVKEIFADKNYSVIGEDKNVVYITESGNKYHRKDCPYCKSNVMVAASLTKAENMKLIPCKCMGKEVVEPTYKQSKPYVTAFVDESIRKNPWCELDESIPKKQGIYSYIICEGMLESENRITEENTLYTCVAPVLEAYGTDSAAIGAILAVMFALVVEGYHDNVLIYTDNLKAMEAWHASEASKNMAKLFTGVMVCHIPREKNVKADKQGRKRSILDVTTKTMDKILRRDKEVKKILEGWFAE